MNATTMTAQIRLTRSSPECWRATFDHPASNLMGPDFVPQFRQIMTVLETDAQTRVIVFGSAVEGFFLDHTDLFARLEGLTHIPQTPAVLEARPDTLVRLTRAPIAA